MRKFLWQLFFTYLIIIFASVAAALFFASRALEGLYLQSLTEDLTARAQLSAWLFAGKFSEAAEPDVERLCRAIGEEIETRISVILPSGKVIGDSVEDPTFIKSHADRPEIKSALAGQVGTARRFSSTVNKEMFYLAVPVMEQGALVGVVRVSLPILDMAATLRGRYLDIAVGGLAIAFFAALIGLLVSRRIERPIAEMIEGAARYARGDLEHRLRVKGSVEIENLASAMNRMAEDLNDRIHTIVSQREELEAVLSGMMEAVLLVDSQEKLVRLNRAALQLFFGGTGDPTGRSLVEALRNPDLLQFVRRTLAAKEPLSGDVALRAGGERFFQGHGVPLLGPAGKNGAALIVLYDITQIKNLENIRKDFVANVSHELRTPITSIKGFVETLQEGALDDPDNARRFLDIIAQHVERLQMIIEDLLRLSRIERESECQEIALAPGRIKPVLEAAGQTCAPKAAEKQIALELSCDEELVANLNTTLLEQAVVNLIDNAIKYSDAGGVVRVVGLEEGTEAVIRVEDRGCGIPSEHLLRIFERFYRVDKARSRDLGGTGLGLAIVKHIANAHQGNVAVQSKPGEGSVFSIRLPKAKATPSAD